VIDAFDKAFLPACLYHFFVSAFPVARSINRAFRLCCRVLIAHILGTVSLE